MGWAPPNGCMPPQPSITQPCGWAGVLLGESRTARAMSQLRHTADAEVADADPNGWTPPQASRGPPATLAAVDPGLSDRSRAIFQFFQEAVWPIAGGGALLPMAKGCTPP